MIAQKLSIETFGTIYEFLFYEISDISHSIKAATIKPNIKKNKQDFGFIKNSIWTDLLNILPERFDAIRDYYCAVSITYTVSVAKLNIIWPYEISNQLRQTNCKESLKDIICEKFKEYESRYHKIDHSNTANSIAAFLLVIILLFVTLFLLAEVFSRIVR